MAKAIASLVLVFVILAILNGADAGGRGLVGKDDGSSIYKSEEFFGIIPFCTYPFFSCFWHLIPPSQCHWYCPNSPVPNSGSAPTPPADSNPGALPPPPPAGRGSAPTPPADSALPPLSPTGRESAPTPPADSNLGALPPPSPAGRGSAPTPPAGASAPPTPPMVPNGGSALTPPATFSATVP